MGCLLHIQIVHGLSPTHPKYIWTFCYTSKVYMDSLLHIQSIHELSVTHPKYTWALSYTSKMCMDSLLHIQNVHGLSPTHPKYTWTLSYTSKIYMDSLLHIHSIQGLSSTKVWQARKQLKGSDIYLNEDFPMEVQDKHQILRSILQRARTMEKQAFLNVDNLMIYGSRYTTDDLDKLPPELDPARIATEAVGDMLVFFGGQSPFSNFHKSNL